MASKAAGKQKKKKSSTEGPSNTPTNSQASIPSAEKPLHLHESTVDDPLTGEELEALRIREEELPKVRSGSGLGEALLVDYCGLFRPVAAFWKVR